MMKMKNWQDRAKKLMRQRNLSQESLAELIGVTQGTIGHYLNKRREAPLSKIDKISWALGVSTQYLLYGELNEKEKIEEIPTIIKKIPIIHWEDLKISKDLSPESISQLLQQRSADGEVLTMYFSRNKIIGDTVGAIDAINVDAMKPDYPHELTIYEKDWLVIDFSVKPKIGQLVIAEIDKGYTVRQYIEDGGKFLLKALNRQYPIITDFEVKGVIIGRMSEWG